jgi:hypothetical protein
MTLNLNPVMSIIANVPAAIASTVRLIITQESFNDVVFFRSWPLAWFAGWQTSPQQAQRCSRKLYQVDCFHNPLNQLQVDGPRLFRIPERPTEHPSSLFFLKATDRRACSGQFLFDISVELLV